MKNLHPNNLCNLFLEEAILEKQKQTLRRYPCLNYEEISSEVQKILSQIKQGIVGGYL